MTVGLSGGIDSIVLLDTVRRAAAQTDVHVRALHVNHGLSPNAAAWERFCTRHCRRRGIEFELLSPAEAKSRHPFLELHDLQGALWDPYDGDIDPSQLTQAYAKGAKDLGCRIQRFTRVTALAQKPDGGLDGWTREETRRESVVPHLQIMPATVVKLAVRTNGWWIACAPATRCAHPG